VEALLFTAVAAGAAGAHLLPGDLGPATVVSGIGLAMERQPIAATLYIDLGGITLDSEARQVDRDLYALLRSIVGLPLEGGCRTRDWRKFTTDRERHRSRLVAWALGPGEGTGGCALLHDMSSFVSNESLSVVSEIAVLAAPEEDVLPNGQRPRARRAGHLVADNVGVQARGRQIGTEPPLERQTHSIG